MVQTEPSNKAVIVGICGPQYSGKSTLARKLAQYANSIDVSEEVWITEYFAKSLYRVTEMLIGIPEGTIDKNKLYTIGNLTKTGREWLQFIGTEVGRDIFGDCIWINNLLDRVGDSKPVPNIVLVHDLRFINESEVCDLIIYLESEKVHEQASDHRSEYDLPVLREKADIELLRNRDNSYCSLETMAGYQETDFEKICKMIRILTNGG